MKRLCILFSLMVLCMGAIAQNPDRGNRPAPPCQFNEEAFRRQVQEFITQNAGLTEQEAKAFFPVFHKYKDEQLAIHKRIHFLKKNPPKSDQEADYQKHVMQIAKLNAEAVQMDVVYYGKLCKIISAKKFYKVLSLEDQMHRNFLKNYNGKRNQKPRAPRRP